MNKLQLNFYRVQLGCDEWFTLLGKWCSCCGCCCLVCVNDVGDILFLKHTNTHKHKLMQECTGTTTLSLCRWSCYPFLLLQGKLVKYMTSSVHCHTVGKEDSDCLLCLLTFPLLALLSSSHLVLLSSCSHCLLTPSSPAISSSYLPIYLMLLMLTWIITTSPC